MSFKRDLTEDAGDAGDDALMIGDVEHILYSSNHLNSGDESNEARKRTRTLSIEPVEQADVQQLLNHIKAAKKQHKQVKKGRPSAETYPTVSPEMLDAARTAYGMRIDTKEKLVAQLKEIKSVTSKCVMIFKAHMHQNRLLSYTVAGRTLYRKQESIRVLTEKTFDTADEIDETTRQAYNHSHTKVKNVFNWK